MDPMPIDVMFVQVEGTSSIGYLHHAPLVLAEAGISNLVVPVGLRTFIDDLRFAVYDYKPSLVIYECYGEPDDFIGPFAYEFPDVQFVSLVHSDIQTMPLERSLAGRTVLDEMVKRIRLAKAIPNYTLAVGRRRQKELFDTIFGVDCLCLPHPVAFDVRKTPKPFNLTREQRLGVGLFGKHRVLKNIPGQAAAVAYFQHAHNWPARLFYNKSNVPADKGFMTLIQASRLRTTPVEWMDQETFQLFLERRIHIGLQLSLSETFNYVALDQMVQGIPVICSKAIEYAPPGLSVNDFTDYIFIGKFIRRIIDGYEDYSCVALEAARKLKKEQNADFLDMINRFRRAPGA